MPPLRAVPPPAGRPFAEQLAGERAESEPAEHYARLVRIAYLVLAPSRGRNRRVLSAHWLAQRALAGGQGPEPGRAYAHVRLQVVRSALEAGLPLFRLARPRRAQFPPLVPQVWGLRLFPHSCGADELALEQALAGVSGACRAAHVLRGLEGLDDAEVCRVLDAAGVADPRAALLEADVLTAPHALLASPEFDPCSLQVRPADPVRRRRCGRTLLAASAALLVCGTLLLMPGDGLGGPDAVSGPPYSRHRSAEQALDPGELRRVPENLWRGSARMDFTVWPTRGDRTADSGLLRRALAAWARPGQAVVSSATPGTPDGPPMGPPQLLYAGEVGPAAVVLFHDGLRVVRYAEARNADPSRGAVLDFARVDGADAVTASALVVQRREGRVRYLTAPWVREVAVRDLLAPRGAALPLRRDGAGVTDPLAGPVPAQGGRDDGARDCRSWPALEVRDGSAARLMTDLGELTPVRLTSGAPSAPHDVAGAAERESWARTACLLPAVRSNGVRTVNSWPYAKQRLPEGEGDARWFCTRADTWRGTGSRVLAQFQAPPEVSGGDGAPGAVAARAEDSPDCGIRRPRVLAGVLWKSDGGRWYVLAAGSRQFASLTATGGVRGRADGRLLALPAGEGDRARLDGLLEDGSRVGALH
ncbi:MULTISPECIES: hypothetical protein [unclassified Streptomyces]|uniref:hypothetical protein n=1 Tax=unclassified Streptomyces TaxID=2593676 RepID=UPI00093FB07D|nr:hypothetical protein [Streptomyces sp. CB02058]OKI96243.1 hypothetical protein AMK10_11480 [Streptomyces sp. CB02058]